MQDINFLAVFLAAIVNLVLGSIWYAPFLFGREWVALSHVNPKKANRAPAYVAAFVTAFVMALVLAHFFSRFSIYTFAEGACLAFAIWIGFMATIMLGGVIWERKPWKLYFIHAGFYLVALQVMSLILIAMN